ncbi:MAG: nonstructural protein [Microvirus sp.]|nr:MAG: nonstructural protein [Microvirus sp.]
MELNVYTVLDLKVKAYGQPYYARTRGEAIRSFQTSINNSSTENMWAKYPTDYCLYEIGTWDDNAGKFTMHETPSNLGLAVQFKNVEASQETNH